ncbi:putative hemolysin [Kaistia dalseonensis]|uniref:L-ornithine N(alpha)-acyltransferase n=2 Tax=Kaistia dalseonensis TaxID=410840 RepID=A0ABU0H579_9HYPH|nr:GNAT family N-acetyltransferase [Kaistia dalseonensis]MDQ0437445.1 putative hemolysin [Kaistia dalseonensis]
MPAPIAALPDLSRRMLQGFRLPMPKGLRPVSIPPEPLGRIGALEVRLATTPREVKKAQKLRYKVFYEEMSAIADIQTQMSRRDRDAFDAICDHLLVIDHDTRTKSGEAAIVGTYRLLRQDVADRYSGFYTANEFDVGPLVARHNGLRFLELGRSCVLPPYRTKRTVELLWHGIWSYVRAHRIDVMIGCASLEGTNPDALALQLSFLHHHARAPSDWSVGALPGRHVAMDRLPPEAIDMKKALHALPPLIKGYLRLGAYVGEGAVIDRQFGTTDVLIVMPVAAINERYVNHYGVDATRYAA